jgi:TonB family protein
MSRLQKKCFIVSAGLHSLLVLILIVGPAFLSSKGKSDEMPTLDFVPARTIDAALSGGGNPKAQPPPPAPPSPPQLQVAQAPPPPPQEPARKADPPREIVRTPKPDPEAVETSTEHKPKLPQVSTKQVVRKTTSPTTSKQSQTSDAEERRQAEAAAQRRVEAVGSMARTLKENLSDRTTIETNPGLVGGGEAYANYAQVVKSIYESAWTPPDDTANDDAITKVTVTIRRDGTVASARIVRACGEARVDSSVQRTLDRVTYIAPFPEGAKDKERTYTINFNLKAKRALG